MNNAKLTAFLKQKVLPNLPYVLIFWFFNKAGNAYRLAPGTDFLQKLTRSAGTLDTAMANPLPSMDVFDLAVGAAGTVIIYFIVWQKKRNARKWRKDVEYGSARWGTPEDIKPFMNTKPEHNMKVRA